MNPALLGYWEAMAGVIHSVHTVREDALCAAIRHRAEHDRAGSPWGVRTVKRTVRAWDARITVWVVVAGGPVSP